MTRKYPELNKMTLCFYCAGCNKLSVASFPGVTKCDSFVSSYDEYYRSLNKEYGSEVESKEK
jgi:hypothetical protein